MYIIFKRPNPETWNVSGSGTPVVHSTYEGAIEEAKRLTALQPNCDFIVFKAHISMRKQTVFTEIEHKFD